MSNLERYKTDLKQLISDGDMLELVMQYECGLIKFTKKETELI